MDDQVVGRILPYWLGTLALGGVVGVMVDFDLRVARSLHTPPFGVIALSGLAACFVVGGAWVVLRKFRARWPDHWLWGSSAGVEEPTFPRDPLPEFCSGVPAATILEDVLFLVVARGRRGEPYDTFVARFDRASNAWSEQSGLFLRRFHHDDRWLLVDEHREAITRATARMGEALNAPGVSGRGGQ